mmetsp:Transcript_33661/g.66198  ORF Transcript_33661/g.66198 Transcript_33661/m.66198 type:complete len:207 (-) Transcript_33661:20-640(-)
MITLSKPSPCRIVTIDFTSCSPPASKKSSITELISKLLLATKGILLLVLLLIQPVPSFSDLTLMRRPSPISSTSRVVPVGSSANITLSSGIAPRTVTNETVSQRSPGCRLTISATECVVLRGWNIALAYPDALEDVLEIKEDALESLECAETLLTLLPRESARALFGWDWRLMINVFQNTQTPGIRPVTNRGPSGCQQKLGAMGKD